MAREKPNKWTRERSFLEVHAGDIVMVGAALLFLVLTIVGVYVFLAQPRIPGLSEAFSAPPAVTGPPPDQKLHLAPGETEMMLYPSKPPQKLPQQKK